MPTRNLNPWVQVEVIERLTMTGAEGVKLGCTEIPLLIQPAEINIPVFSTTELHCIAAIDRSLDNDARA